MKCLHNSRSLTDSRWFTTRCPHKAACARLVSATKTKAGRDVLLIADDVAKSYDGDKQLFTSLTFSVVAGEKLAVCGQNGSGKSSLLKIIAGLDQMDSGVMNRNKGAAVGYLPQDPQLPEEATVLQAVLQSDSAVARAVQAYERALSTADGAITKELEAAIDKMNTYNAWEIDAEAKRILEAVGIPSHLLGTTVAKLSGGQRKRVALAGTLLGKPDLLVLDEPTNHMDVDMIDWMEKELKKEAMAVVLVTHDRYFMENICDRILELDNGRCFMHDFGGPGAYQLFKEAREFRRKAQANAAADARTLFKREAEWIVKQPKARQAKSQARVNAFVELTEKTRDVPKEDLKADFGGAGMIRQGNKVVRMKGVSYTPPGFNEPLIKDFAYDFTPGERLGIVGRNGAGKTTLLNLISGETRQTSGVREVGETTVFGYFTQYPPEVRNDMRVINYIREIADDRKASSAGFEQVDTPEVLLEKLGFPRARQHQYVSSLSGGERRRLHLASVLVERPNLLILDEPTNDLDLQTVEVVEEVVKAYKGVLLVVSHDRAFMDAVAPRLLVLKGDGLVRMFQGSYSEYLSLVAEEREEEEAMRQLELEEQREKAAAAAAQFEEERKAAAAFGTSTSATGNKSGISGGGGSGGRSATAVAEAPASAVKRKISYYEGLEYTKICKEMDRLNAEKEKLDAKVMALAQAGDDFDALEKASIEMGRVADQLDALSDRWMELAELAGDL
ncbi:hypothetical protein CEUSTIGMA_g2747.t1 [Chlamydomonas eustigma]|uniref:ABC transporter domain-containing protein n=1 Tax=Chlamydomonas eustigma TaxID=1157962 RepID=A0A250WXF2_9CHLO|nr:hypothetical protein CEUSTIGMA_g2747.t1 [Chlamydomonas eustigma]|eukprot:GAX75302.1 hypothetical protein CEUSTIGMA_g2747.t1 [Chlamydomonas eustigma]